MQAYAADSGILIATETFDYAAGPVTGLNGGMGWDGKWFASPLTKTDATVMAGKFARTPGHDFRFFRRIDTSRPELRPYLDNGRLGKDGTTIWIAFTMAISDVEGNSAAGYGSIHLNDGVSKLDEDIFGNKRDHQRVQVGDRNSAEVFYLGRVTNGAPGSSGYDSTVPVERRRRLLVTRIDFKDGAEYAALFVDPTPGKTPSNDSAVAQGPMSDFRFDIVQFGSGGSRFPQQQIDFDELRIGTAFDVVVPAGSRH